MAGLSHVSAGTRGGGLTFRRVRTSPEAGDEALKVTLFRGRSGEPCGWFIGPLLVGGGRISIPYLPKSKQTLASVAVLRAARLAKETRGIVCLVDPDDLWDAVWRT